MDKVGKNLKSAGEAFILVAVLCLIFGIIFSLTLTGPASRTWIGIGIIFVVMYPVAVIVWREAGEEEKADDEKH